MAEPRVHQPRSVAVQELRVLEPAQSADPHRVLQPVQHGAVVWRGHERGVQSEHRSADGHELRHGHEHARRFSARDPARRAIWVLAMETRRRSWEGTEKILRVLLFLSASALSTAQNASVPSSAGRLYFLDVRGGRVVSAAPDGSDVRVIVSGRTGTPDGI